MNKYKTLIAKLSEMLFFVSLAFILFHGVPDIPFHGDEASIISISRDCHKLLNGDLGQVTYSRHGNTDQFLRLTTGSFVPFSIFVATKTCRIPTDSINKPWQWHQQEKLDEKTVYALNKQNGNMPPKSVLVLSRYLQTSFVFFSVVLLYVIVYSITRTRLASALISALYASTPVILCDGRRAMQEGALIFFLLLALLLVVRIADKTTKAEQFDKSIFWRYLFLGIVSGLSISTKHNASLAVLALYLFLFLFIKLKVKEKHDKSRLNVLTIISILAMSLIYFLMNPIWWTANNILNLCILLLLLIGVSYLYLQKYRSQKKVIISLLALSYLLLAYISIVPFAITYKTRVNLMEWQSTLYTDMDSYGLRARKIAEELFFNKSQFIEPTEDLIADNENQTNRRFLFVGRRPVLPLGIFFMALLVFSIIKMGYHTFKYKNWIYLGLLTFLFVPLAIVYFTNKIPWSRYYLIIQPQFYIIIGVGVKLLIDDAKKVIEIRLRPNSINRTIKRNV